MLRPYQQRSIDQLYEWMGKNDGNPCLVLPTGSGKSHIIAEICKDAVQNWPETRILMLTHVKELIEQNAAKLRACWPNAPMGIYSASIGRKELDEPITFAGIQSIRKKSQQIGHVDLIIIDECHLVSHKEEGGYRTLIAELQKINPLLRVIGLTASPYRLGHGLITDKPAIFDDLIRPVEIPELIYLGHLATLKSKVTEQSLDVSGVGKRGGEYIESQLQAAVNIDHINQAVVDEVIRLAGDRKSWLFFCAGVEHAQAISECLVKHGIASDCLTGKNTKKEREAIIDNFKSGRIRALTNVSVLTTGFDYPDIDLLVLLRPTMSPSLYIQMAGRGMRPKSHTDHCLVLDFAGVVQRHGPIIDVQPPSKSQENGSEPPTKECPECREIIAAQSRTCHNCGYEFPVEEKEPEQYRLRNDDIMGIEASEMDITDWSWRVHISRTSGDEMPAVTYYGGFLDEAVTEYFPINHIGWAGEKATRTIGSIAAKSGASLDVVGVSAIVEELSKAKPPRSIKYKRDGKFYRVLARVF